MNSNICNLKDTPLHLAVKDSNLEDVRALLDKGAKIDAVDEIGDTPLHWAIRGGNKEIVDALSDKGAKVDVR